MSNVKRRLRRFELVLRLFLDIARSGARRAPRFPAEDISRGHSLLAGSLGRLQPAREKGTTLTRGALFGFGGSMSEGRIRHFNESNFAAVPSPSFAPVGDIRREAQARRHKSGQDSLRKRSVIDVLLRR